MSVAAELDLAIGQIDDLLRKLQGKISQPTASLVNEPNAKSEEPAVALDPALPLKRMSTNALGVQALKGQLSQPTQDLTLRFKNQKMAVQLQP